MDGRSGVLTCALPGGDNAEGPEISWPSAAIGHEEGRGRGMAPGEQVPGGLALLFSLVRVPHSHANKKLAECAVKAKQQSHYHPHRGRERGRRECVCENKTEIGRWVGG